MGKYGEWPVEHDAHHLPVPGHRVFPCRCFRHASDGRTGAIGQHRLPQRRDPAEPERSQRGQLERYLARNVAHGVAALIAVRGRVGKLADADAVENDHDGSMERDHGLRIA